MNSKLYFRVLGGVTVLILLWVAGCYNERKSPVSFQPVYDARWIYGGAEDDTGESVITTDDGGYAVVGATSSFGAGDSDVYLLKIDAAGNLEWQRTFGGAAGDEGHTLIQTSDGGFVIAGKSKSVDDQPVPYIWVIRTDASGKTVWKRLFESGWGSHYTVVLTGEDGLVIGGSCYDDTVGYKASLIGMDLSGDVPWWEFYRGGDSASYTCHDVTVAPDGGFIITGTAHVWSDDRLCLLTLKTDHEGNLLWERMSDTDRDFGVSIKCTSDDGFVVAGLCGGSTGYGYDICLTRFDADGYVVWRQVYGDEENNVGESVVCCPDGGYAITGYTTIPGEEAPDAFLIKTDAGGNMQWQQTYGGSMSDYGNDIACAPDGGYVITGAIGSYGTSYMKDVWLIKTDDSGVQQE
ncbi:MAG: hypothetical protein JSW34_01370 [Candidatus Zixiibacteriota bacterium]|nr:MAG: hypothetical protein JSW34_01370 [candidate division Zixibacteria bacterium]